MSFPWFYMPSETSVKYGEPLSRLGAFLGFRWVYLLGDAGESCCCWVSVFDLFVGSLRLRLLFWLQYSGCACLVFVWRFVEISRGCCEVGSSIDCLQLSSIYASTLDIAPTATPYMVLSLKPSAFTSTTEKGQVPPSLGSNNTKSKWRDNPGEFTRGG